jgi:ribosome-associated protein
MTRRTPSYTDLEPPSKSELKRRSRDLRDLGDTLVELSAGELDALSLPEDVRDAVDAAREITSHGARLRQRLYIGKLLRRIDTTPIEVALDRKGAADRARVRGEHQIEEWRDRLLAAEPADWDELAQAHPNADLAELRSLANQARAERGSGRPPAAARQLFRRLRSLLAAPASD